MRENTAGSRRGIWRASIPTIAAAVCLPLPKRQSRPRLAQSRGRQWKLPAPTQACLYAILLFVQASALPMHLGFFLLPHHAKAMTEGCEKVTCCTALCYLDKHGIHHCVHLPGDSCGCGMSADECQVNPVLLSALVTLPAIEDWLPAFIPAGWIHSALHYFSSRMPDTPSPPPK